MPDNSNDLSIIYDKIKSKYGFKSPQSSGIASTPIPLPTTTSLPKFENFSYDRPENLYQTLDSGQKVARYENYIPGTDNNERLANSQGSGEKWLNGLQKFGTKTINAVIGGTAGVVYGVGDAIAEGNAQNLYDNNFSNWLTDLDTKVNYQLPNLYNKQEQSLGLLGQATTANFWADKVLGGLSFTTGAIVSEGIWAWATGGTSLGSSGARLSASWASKFAGLGRIAKATSKFSNFLKSSLSVGEDVARVGLSSADDIARIGTSVGGEALAGVGAINTGRAVAFGKAGDVLNTLRFTMTSAGYEASVEALQFKKEQEYLFYNNFQTKYGRQPSEQEISDFQENLSSSANAVFGVNMALVGSSNLVTLGNIFNLKSPIKTGFSETLNKTLYGIGKSAPSKIQSINRRVLPFIKNAVTEGLYEEGGQSITSRTAGTWLQHAYDPNATKDSFDLSGSLYESISHQYGSKEGWVENGVGMIIGLLGEGITRNSYSEIQREAQEFETRNELNKTYTSQALSERFLMLNRIKGFTKQVEEAKNKGNITEARIAQDGVIFSMLNNRYQLGDSVSDVTSDISKALSTVTQDQLSESGIDTDLNIWKKEQISAFTEVANSFKKNRQFAEYIIGRNPGVGIKELEDVNQLRAIEVDGKQVQVNNQEALIQSLAFTMMGGQRASTVMKEAVSEVSQLLGYEQAKALDTIATLERVTQEKKSQVNIAVNASRALEEQRSRLVQELRTAESTTIKGDTETGDRVLRISERLSKVDNLISQNQEELQQLASEINLNSKTLEQTSGIELNQQELVTVEDLKNLDKNTQNLDKVLQAIKQSNPENSARLEGVIEEFNNARKLFGTYQNTVLAFTNGKIRIDNINTLIGRKILKKGKSLDESTKEWLSEMLEEYSSRAVKAVNDISNLKKPESEVSKDSVIEKLRKAEQLNEEELALYNENKDEIDTFIKREVTIPIEPEPATKTKLEYLRERLSDLISRTNNSLSFIGTAETDFLIKKPTQAEINEYEKSLKSGIPNQELQEKLSQWRVLDSFVNEEGMTIADLVELIQQHEQNVAEEETKTEVSEDDVLIADPEEKTFGNKNDYSSLQNTTGNATIHKNKNGTITLTHISAKSLLNFIGEPYSIARGGKTIDIEKVTIGDKITTASGIILNMINGGNISMKSTDFNKTGLLTIDSQSGWTYFDLYYNNGFEYVKKGSDIVDKIEAEEIYNLEPNTTVRFEIDRQDTYTKELLYKYKKSQTEQNRKALTEGIKIFAVVNGKRVSTLKAERGDSPDNFKLLREKAFELATQQEYENDLQVTSKITDVNIGSPQFFINIKGKLETKAFTSSSIQNILATGYILNGKLTLSETIPKVNTMYVSKISKAYSNMKMPIVIVKRGINYVALPIALNKIQLGQNGLKMVDEALSLSKIPKEIAKNLNNLINQKGVKTEKLLVEEVNNENINRIRRDFEKHLGFTTADELASSTYQKNNLMVDASMYVDIDNLPQVISSPKIKIDLANMYFNQTENTNLVDLLNLENINSQVTPPSDVLESGTNNTEC